MADLYLTPAERYTAALGGFYYGDLPEPGTVYTQLIKDILNGSTPDKEPKNSLARFIYSLYISDLGDPYPRYELAKLLYWKLHDITPTKSGSVLTVTIDGEEDYMTINTDLSRLWYKVLFGSKTDVITEFPYIFNTMQNKLSDWELFGNTIQTGTPTPDNPVMPQGTGERTGNLIDYAQSESGGIDGSGNYVPANNLWRSTAYTPIDETLQYFVSWTVNTNLNVVRINYYTSDKTHISREQINTSGTALTIPQNAAYFKWTLYAKTDFIIDLSFVQSLQLMINTGSTALPYEPFGVKIPILSASTTTPVYLGEVETTRKIYKYEFKGSETWGAGSENYYSFVPQIYGDGVPFSAIICSHCSNATINNTGQAVWFKKTAFPDITTGAELKQFCADQYAAGTPVTVWYVLATEQTGIVNEPLMKIGEYADSMSRAHTGIDIPTVIGQNTLDVLTTVKPSSMSIEYTSADENRSRSNRISLLKSPLKKRLIK